MDFLGKALRLHKKQGGLSTPLVMQKFKITADEAQKLIENVENHLDAKQLRLEDAQPKLKKIEMHLTAEYH